VVTGDVLWNGIVKTVCNIDTLEDMSKSQDWFLRCVYMLLLICNH
jgi:hypothetical protein